MIGSVRRALWHLRRIKGNSSEICLFLLAIFFSSLLMITIASRRDERNISRIQVTEFTGSFFEEVSAVNTKPSGAETTHSFLGGESTTTTSLKTGTPKMSGSTDSLNVHEFFGKVIRKIYTDFDPKITPPFSGSFKEKDTTDSLIDTSLGSYIKKCLSPGYWESSMGNEWPLLTYESLQSSYLTVQESVKEKIKQKHMQFIKEVQGSTEMDYPGSKKYSGSGIVFVAGGEYSVLAYSVIKLIRNRGTTLPIEVLIPDSDGVDDKFCTLLSKELNGKCIYLSSIFDDEILSTYKFKGFQYKSLALMASSFENCLLLDADDYPLKDLNDIFKDEAFTENGLILWPDFWRRTTHPFFYESANIKINRENRVRNFIDKWSPMRSKVENLKTTPYHDFEGALPDPSSETGQLMINKKRHWKTLLLSLYYNVHGPNLYYHLLSQYSAGQGDKDTFIAAAHVLDLPYYQVLSVPSMDGYHLEGENGGYRGVAYYQKDFRYDYLVQKELREKMNANLIKVDKDYSPTHFRDEYFRADLSKSNALFAHCNLPKFDPVSLAHNMEYTYENKHFRGLNSKECLGDLDIEKEITQSYYDVICGDTENIFFWLVRKNDSEVCDYLSKRLELFENSPL